eukprot:PhM_4_TR13253/c0_g2_i1/m.100940
MHKTRPKDNLPRPPMPTLPLVAQPPSSRKGPRHLPPERRCMVPENFRTSATNDSQHNHLVPVAPPAAKMQLPVINYQHQIVSLGNHSDDEEEEEEITSLVPLEMRHRRERERLVPLLLQVSNSQASSAALACDVVMSQARQLSGSSGRGPSLVRASMAWYCLEVLLKTSANNHLFSTLRAIRDDLHDALFFLRDPGVRVAPIHEQVHMGALVTANPFMGHLFYFEMYQRSKAAAQLSGSKLERMMSTASHHQSIVRRTILQNVYKTKHVVFYTWSKYTKMKRQKRLVKHHMRAMQGRDLDGARKDAAFARWRLAVEMARSATLTERQTMMQFQLQNVKNQFQLQCFKTDKFLRTIEELRVELAVGRAERDEALREIEHLNAKLEEQGDRKTKEMNQKISIMGREVQKWKNFALSLMGEITRLSNYEVEERPTLAEIEKDPSPPPTAEVLPIAVTSSKDKKKKAPLGAAQKVAVASAELRPVESALLRWLNGVLHKHPELHSGHLEVLNFSTDLQDGIILITLLHVLAPAMVPIALVQEPNVATRLERMCQAAEAMGVPFVPDPKHIAECDSDITVLFLANIFLAMSSNEIHKGTSGALRQSTETLRHSEENPSATANSEEALDALTIHLFLAESDAEMTDMVLKLQDVQQAAHGWNQVRSNMRTYVSETVRERLSGNPRHIMDVKEHARFTRVPKSRLKDLHWKYNNPPNSYKGDWPSWELQLEDTRRFFRANYNEVRRVFTYYAGSSGNAASMSSTEWWQFVTDCRFVDKLLNKSVVERVFMQVNQDDGLDHNSDGEDTSRLLSDDGEDENPLAELIPTEFVEALIRLADAKFLETTLPEKIRSLWNEHVVPYSCRSEAVRVRRDINAPATQKVIKRYNKDMGKVFTYYTRLISDTAEPSSSTPSKGRVGAPQASARGKGTVRVHEFLAMLRDAHFISDTLTTDHVKSVLRSVQLDTSSSVDVTDDTELSYAEFMSGVTIIACFVFPSPFVAFETKVDATLSKVIDGVRPRLKAVGINLMEVKHIVAM